MNHQTLGSVLTRFLTRCLCTWELWTLELKTAWWQLQIQLSSVVMIRETTLGSLQDRSWCLHVCGQNELPGSHPAMREDDLGSVVFKSGKVLGFYGLVLRTSCMFGKN